MKHILILLLLMAFTEPASAAEKRSYRIEKLGAHLYAAIANPDTTATSNAFFYIGEKQVVAGGAHMTAQASNDLLSAISEKTRLPLRYFILPHHHEGYTSVDFYLPDSVDVVMTLPVWQALQQEAIPFPNEAVLYSEGLTLKVDNQSIILTNLGSTHSSGDTLVYFPQEKVLFTSDLLYIENVGYMGEGHMENWVLALEFANRFNVDRIIPGHGPVSPKSSISDFSDYLKSFLSETIKHIEAGDSLEKTKREFNLPQYKQYSGYDQLLEVNIERAYRNLGETVLAR